MITLPVWALVLLIVALCAIALGTMAAVALANRLNRLHIRTDSARLSLEGALAARASVMVALQPELSGEVSRVGRVALRADDMSARSDVENALLSKLHAENFSHSAFIEAATRVDLAARFYNDAVGATLAVRCRPVVKGLHLAGRAPLPEYYEAMSAESAGESY